MNLRALLLILVGGFAGLLIAMGLVGFLRWLKLSYPRSFRLIVGVLVLAVVGSVSLIFYDMLAQQTFRPSDLLTVHEPVVARGLSVARESRALPCIIDSSEHLAVIETTGGTVTARVESNNTSAPVYCAVGIDVQIEADRLHRVTVTHRQPS